ncbi:hypothetical protein CPT_Magnus_072 [Klebsiella phage Magnus]|uniref:Uncharacterized protein n=1 Tax=Klebsiella phage Magnus TaxID=2589660 RepID=A0A5B9N8Z9_9CAUD|nr:hypothetical protein HYP92_gp169 [Klebsiella phage Magnus]QEG07951.1 hypothetical protein CPT_Magnus_072 [Klebsiella phage Magnus]
MSIQLTISSLIPAFGSNLEQINFIRKRLEDVAFQLGYVEPPREVKEAEDVASPSNLIDAYDEIGRKTNVAIQQIFEYLGFIENALGNSYHPQSDSAKEFAPTSIAGSSNGI